VDVPRPAKTWVPLSARALRTKLGRSGARRESFRVKVVDKIPELIDLLIRKSSDLASEMAVKAGFVKELANILSQSGPMGSKE